MIRTLRDMRRCLLAVTGVAMAAAAISAAWGQESAAADALIARVADAMGGADAILGIHTLEANGYGAEAYFWGGGNVTGDPEAVQKWAENPEMAAIWDFDNDRYLTRYRHNFMFPFGGIFGHSFSLSTWGLDGDVGYTVGGTGAGQRLAEWTTNGSWFKPDGASYRKFESLSHPLAAVRAVLSGDAVAANLRIEGNYQLLDLAVDEGVVTLAIDPATLLPRSVSWAAPHQNLGEVELTTTFVGYEDWDGVMLPLTWSTRIDWRNTLVQTRMLDGYYINSTHTPDISAPASARRQPVPEAAAAIAQPITTTQIADGIWHLNPGGHTIVEFADHLVIFEMGGSNSQTRAVIDFANRLVPGKPLTHLIVSHHHFDHTSGFRAAVEAGLTVISHRGNEQILSEIAARPAPDFPDLVALPDGGSFDFVPVDGHLRLQDERMTLDIYAVVKHNHMANAVFAYAPESKTLMEGDLATPANQFSFWAEAYQDNLEHYGLEVAMVSPNHVAAPMTHEETLAWIAEGVPAALARCAQYAELGRNLPGCPAFIFRDWSDFSGE
jgi:glyoxylase-like metal-dependent hydrolase (beta-lactamase superfamily II)